ncbi:hypothetical protein SOHN41_02463 [Shewanella sp. HN-41]|nr:hypothetical protein SOHN41_02463 [Shewanella sp. HN-41]
MGKLNGMIKPVSQKQRQSCLNFITLAMHHEWFVPFLC